MSKSPIRANRKTRWLSILVLLVLALPGLTTTSFAQTPGNSRLFSETGKTVSGKFLQYWDSHGALAQQGYPISEEMQERSDTDGKTYKVQYFERAVFEDHPENAAPNDVLLQLLGVFFYQQKYPSGAPGQTANNEANSRLFSETGQRLGGVFLDYWNTHGGLAQQGFPISNEFVEVSATDGKPYKVQYFERAVFEFHPENPAPNNVLLSLLGTFRLQSRGAAATPTVASPAATPTTAPVNTPVPQPTSVPTAPPNPAADCSNIPPSVNQIVRPNCGPGGTIFEFEGFGFTPGESVGVYATGPDGRVSGAPVQADADGNGRVTGITFRTGVNSMPGIWANSMEGTQSGVKSIGYFKITTGAAPTPTVAASGTCDTSGNRNGESTPSSGRPGDTLIFRARGFTPGEAVSFWFTLPSGVVLGTAQPVPGEFVNPDGTIGPLPYPITPADVAIGTGRWALTFQGASSNNVAVIYFCVNP
ncbi:MAG TPA: hypothetical protein VEX13_07130 [Chloroflexia bacterium]|nr:hypothetical protein [Chloroflexia bacterium]